MLRQQRPQRERRLPGSLHRGSSSRTFIRGCTLVPACPAAPCHDTRLGWIWSQQETGDIKGESMAQLWPRWLLFTAASVVTCAVAGASVSTEHRGVIAVEAADASAVLPGASSTPNLPLAFATPPPPTHPTPIAFTTS